MLENPNFPVTPWTMVRGVVAAVRSTEHNNLSVLRPPSPQERERGSSRRGGSQIDIFRICSFSDAAANLRTPR
jgi:hypothetical protein